MGCLVQVKFDSSVDTQYKLDQVLHRHEKFFGSEIKKMSEEEDGDRIVCSFYVPHGVEEASRHINGSLKRDKRIRSVKIVS